MIVVLSDGKDEGSGLTADDVLQRQRETRVPIYAAGYSHLRGDERRRYLDVLHRLARASGGAYREATGQAIEAIYHDLSNAVRNVVVSTWTCHVCVADGSSKRLQLHYEQGSRSLTDGLALRLLPDLAQVPDAAPDAPSDAAENSSPLWERLDVQALAGAATVLLLLAVLFARRRRARQAEADGAAGKLRRRAANDTTLRCGPNSLDRPLDLLPGARSR